MENVDESSAERACYNVIHDPRVELADLDSGDRRVSQMRVAYIHL